VVYSACKKGPMKKRKGKVIEQYRQHTKMAEGKIREKIT
jgi:hypothetical protein